MFIRTFVCAGFFLNLLVPALGAVHEQLPAPPSGWSKTRDANASSPIDLIIALHYKNLDKLESKLGSVSTPGSPEYGKYLDQKQVNSLFPPADNEPVVSWLKKAGIPKVHGVGGSVEFSTDVGTANKLLNASFAYYSNGNSEKLRTLSYSVPDHLVNDINLVLPTTYFEKEKTASISTEDVPHAGPVQPPSNSSVEQSCRQGVTPACLKTLYNIGDYVPVPKSGSQIAFGSFIGQEASSSDLKIFEQANNITLQNFTTELTNANIHRQNKSSVETDEANLDVQTLIGIIHPLPVVQYITVGNAPFDPNAKQPKPSQNENEPFLSFYEYLLSRPNSKLPQVITNSYGDDEQTVPEFYAKRVCNLIGLLGLRGVSVLEASGDTGVGGPCQSNDGKKTPQFTPQFPGTCPYVTAVGGTQGINPVAAWTKTSGGFSNYFARPSYQEEAVKAYLSKQIDPKTKEEYSKYANFSGRGFPDVSAHSLQPGYKIVQAGKKYITGGTSAASPTFAGIVALLNDARLRAKKPALGFLNPLLYHINQQGFNDVTHGGSKGCTGIDMQQGETIPGASVIPGASWNSTAGWDPATGLGTPDFQRLKEIVLGL